MNDNPISNPFDEDDKKSSKSVFDNSAIGLPDAGDSNRWMLVWISLGILVMCCGLIAGGALIYYRPNAQQLIGQYFPSATTTPSLTPRPTATATLTPSLTPRPTATAT